jgi:hypothetical protein
MFDPKRHHDDVVAELQRWAALKVGDPIPISGWGEPLTALFNDAINEILQLRGANNALRWGKNNGVERLIADGSIFWVLEGKNRVRKMWDGEKFVSLDSKEARTILSQLLA